MKLNISKLLFFYALFLSALTFNVNAANSSHGMSSALKIPLLMSAKMSSPVTTLKDLLNLPLLSINSFQYAGGFRIKAGTYGESMSGWSDARLAYNKDARTLFMTGHRLHASIAEYDIPALVKSNDVLDFNITASPKQNFVKVLERVQAENTQRMDRIGGIAYINGELLIQTYQYYDANANKTFTSLVLRNANDLMNSAIDGFFELNGKAHTVLWVTPVPADLQLMFRGDYIVGASGVFPISGRSSIGPSAFVLQSGDVIATNKSNGLINTLKLLDFDLDHIMAKNEQGWLPFGYGWQGNLQYNYSGPRPSGQAFVDNYDPSLVGDNDFWTQGSKAQFGIMIPGSRTYAVFGSSSMHNSGGGYKIRQKGGRLCGGPCAYDAMDMYNYYWLFDLQDLYQVMLGNKKSYEVKPYDYGLFKTPFDDMYDVARKQDFKGIISGGTYNEKDGIIYLSIPGADKAQHFYDPPPIVMAYKVSLP